MKDPGIYVIDEVIGYLLTVLWFGGPSLTTLVVAFFVFRFFDILKPPPVVQAERLPDGTGIVADDMVAGLYAGLVLWGMHETYQGLLAAGDLLPPTSFG